MEKMRAEEKLSKKKSFNQKEQNKLFEKKKREKQKDKRRVKERGGFEFTMNEIEDINEEFRLLKKLKKRKISQKEYDNKMGINQNFNNLIFSDKIGSDLDRALNPSDNTNTNNNSNNSNPTKKKKRKKRGKKKVASDGITLTVHK